MWCQCDISVDFEVVYKEICIDCVIEVVGDIVDEEEEKEGSDDAPLRNATGNKHVLERAELTLGRPGGGGYHPPGVFPL